MDLFVAVYERQVLPLLLRESRSSVGIEFRRWLDFYCEIVFSKPLLHANLENIHSTGQDGPQRLLVRAIEVFKQSRRIGAFTRETRERDSCVALYPVNPLMVVLMLNFDGIDTNRKGMAAEILQ